MVDLYEDIGDTSRRLILAALKSGPKNVGEIVSETGLKQPNVSNHLARMRSRRIVAHVKSGRMITYSLASPAIEAVLDNLLALRAKEVGEPNFEALLADYVRYAISGDEEAVSAIMNEAFKSNSNLIDIYENLLAPAMRRVGELYGEGKIDVAEEHLASEITVRMMSQTVRIAGPARRNGKSCVVGCAVNDYHVIGARMATDCLRLCGWKTQFFGANLPIRSFLTAVYQNQPDLALVSCTIDESHVHGIQLVKELRSLRRAQNYYVIGVGGSITEKLADAYRDAGADFATNNLKKFTYQIAPAIEKLSVPRVESAWDLLMRA